MKKLLQFVTIIVVFLSFTDLVFANDDPLITRNDVLDVAKELHPPGCTNSMTADYCPLATAYPLRNEILDMLQQGMHKQEIIDVFVERYGYQILAAPEKKGFQLVAWILPFVAVAAGALITFFVVRAFRRNFQKKKEQPSTVVSSNISDENRQKIETEMKHLL